MAMLQLPERITFPSIESLLETLFSADNEPSIAINMERVDWIDAAGIAALLGVIIGWSKQGKILSLAPGEDRAARRYMQRMNFFNLCGINIPEMFERQNPNDSFLPFQPIEHGAKAESELSERIARCVARPAEDCGWTDQPPPEGIFDAIVYASSELIRNVQQHAGGPGFVIAQKYPKRNETQVVICDTGIGMRASFEQSGSPHARHIQSDADAVELALKPKISSKTHIKDPYTGGSENAGVGLSLLSQLAALSNGNFRIASGSGFACKRRIRSLRCRHGYYGTLVCFRFATDYLEDFTALLENAKAHIDMGGPADNVDVERIFQ